MSDLTSKQRGELNFWIDYVHGGGCERESGLSYLDQWGPGSRSRLDFYFRNVGKPVARENVAWADVGCGPYSLLFEAPPQVTKLMIDPLIIEYQRHRLLPPIPMPPNSVAIQASAEKIPLLNASVDIVFCNNTIDHVEEPWASLRELVRILKPGGFVMMELDTGGVTDELHPHALAIGDIDGFLAGLDMTKLFQHLPTGEKRRPGATLYQAIFERKKESLRHFPDVWPPALELLHPTLVAEGICGFNVVKLHDPQRGDLFYGLHQSDGPFYYTKVVAGEYRKVFTGTNLDAVRQQIEQYAGR